jgi:pteridine reductase
MNTPVVLVTGAARRVGAEISRTLHAAGANVVLHYRDSVTEATALAAELNARREKSALAVRRDLSDVAVLPELIAAIVQRFGRLDALVNNASSFFPTPLGSIDAAVWDDLIGSNLKGPLFLSQAAAPQLARALLPGGGCIVNITDIHAERPLKGYPLYCTAKAGLLGLTRALALELAPAVRVNAVAPGAIEWPENDSDFPAAARAAIIDHTLLKRVGSPADIARTVKFLVFDAPYITGQVINVDGGRTAHL